MNSERTTQKTFTTDILILGGGIGGYETFRTVVKQLKSFGIKKKVMIVDKNSYFTFAPLLHEVASGAVEPSHASAPLRELVYKTPGKFVKAEVHKIVPNENKVMTSVGDINYTYCVVALGSDVNYYGVPGAKEFSYNVRTLSAAMALRETIVQKMETCAGSVTMTVVGGGYTGVEVAGQLQDLINDDMRKLYPEKRVTLRLVQTGPTLVPVLPTPVQQAIYERLTHMGVEIILDDAVQEVKNTTIKLTKKGEVESDITVWCAGFATTADRLLDAGLCEKGRIPVTNYLTHPSFANLYAVGDIILGRNAAGEQPYPQLGEAAHKQGEYVGKHLVASLRNTKMPTFYFKSLGTIMPIGDGYGIVAFQKFLLFGWFAWWIRRTVYVAFFPGFLRKLKIILNWTLRLFGFSYILEVEK